MSRDDPGPSTPFHAGGDRLTVDIVRRSPSWARARIGGEALTQAARAAHAAAGHGSASDMALVLTCDDEIQELNRRWRGLDRPTNVLAFPASIDNDADGGDGLGDVVLAYGTVIREADEAGVPRLDHARHLVVHGVLHLLGYDHHNPADAAEMEALETRILARLGVPDPYAEATAQPVLEQ